MKKRRSTCDSEKSQMDKKKCKKKNGDNQSGGAGKN